MKRSKLIIAGLALLFLFAIPQVIAENNTTIDIIVIGGNDVTGYINSTACDGDVTGYINGTAINGSVSYYIDGVEVKGEFDDVWASISRVRGMAQDAYSFAGNAYLYAENNHNTIVELSLTVGNNTNKIYMLRDELVAFENDYIIFKSDTNINISYMKYDITENAVGIHDLNMGLSNLREKHNTLEFEFHLMFIPVFGFLVCFGVIIWVFHKQKHYIDHRYKKLEKYIDKQLILEKQFKVEEKNERKRVG